MSEEIFQMIADKTGIKKSKKPKNITDKKIPKIVQKLKLFGKSCGFTFESLDGKLWKCDNADCQVEIKVDENLLLADNNHYLRYIIL